MPSLKHAYLLHHLLETDAAQPDKQAIVDGKRAIDYATFNADLERCAGVLHAHGIARGDRVAIFLPKGYDECWAIFGASRAGGVFVPINPVLRAPQASHIIRDSEARFLITTSELWASLRDAFDATGPLKSVLLLDAAGETSDAALAPNAFAAAASEPAPASAAIGEDLAAILYTSGSTGAAKGVMLSHRNLLAGARIVSTYLDITADDRTLSILPLSFDYGLNQLITSVQHGATLVPMTFSFGDEIVNKLASERITGLAGVPTLWAILKRAAGTIAKTPLPHLRYLTNSGGAVPVPTVNRLRELFPDANLVLMYGLTEAFRSTYLPPDELDRRPESIGKAIPETEVFVVDEHGQRVSPGTPGILVHRGPTVSMGYWRRPEDTAKVLRPNPTKPAGEGAEMVCFSGDLVREDEDGFLYFVARNDGMIKSSGYRISPSEVEEQLMATGAFEQVAVIGLPHDVIGQTVHAIAIPTSPDVAVRDVLAECAHTLPPHMIPRNIELVDAMPTSPNGKVDYKTLRNERLPQNNRPSNLETT